MRQVMFHPSFILAATPSMCCIYSVYFDYGLHTLKYVHNCRANLYVFVLFLHHRTLCDGAFTHTNMDIYVQQIYINLCYFRISTQCVIVPKKSQKVDTISQLNAILSYTQICTYFSRTSIFLHLIQHTVCARAREGRKMDSTPTWFLQVAYRCAQRVSLASRTIVFCTALYI